MTDTTLPAAPERKTILGHPRGLAILFFTEMWEIGRASCRERVCT